MGNPPKLLHSEDSKGPFGRRVRISYYADGSIRVKIPKASPMAVDELFVAGEGKDVISRFFPKKPIVNPKNVVRGALIAAFAQIRDRLVDAYGRYGANELEGFESVDVRKAKYDASKAEIAFEASVEVRVRDFVLVSRIDGDVYLSTCHGPAEDEIDWEWSVGPNINLVGVTEINRPPQKVEVPGGTLTWAGTKHCVQPDVIRVAPPK